MNVYKITNKINNKIYIGQTIQRVNKRFSAHIRNSKKPKPNMLIARAIKRYGEKNFFIEEIEKCNSIKQLNEREIYWIKKLNSKNRKIGYNLTDGGVRSTLGHKHSKKTIKIISEKLIGRPLSNETKVKISKALKGRIITDETRIKMSKANKGKVVSNDTKEKLRLINMGKKHSEETKRKISKSLLGNKNGIGYKHTEETKRKMSKKARTRKIKI